MERHRRNPRSREANRLAAAKFRLDNPTYFHGQYKITKERNPGGLRANWAHKRANRKHAVPRWLTSEQKDQIKQIYANRPEGYHVDHIVPIKGKDVRGLHVPWNLQYLPALENIKKNNKLQGYQ